LAGNQVSGHRTTGEESARPSQGGLSYRLMGRNLGLSKNTVMEIVKREVEQLS
jgi:hypothetical protein